MSDTNDSVYLPPDKQMTIRFYAPTTHPSVNGQYGTAIPTGDNYNFYVYLSGYDEMGRTFFMGQSTQLLRGLMTNSI